MKKFVLLGLLAFFSLELSAQYYWSKQPGPVDGMDAQLRFQYPNQNAEQMKDFKAIKWTCGAPCGSRGLLKFDLSALIDSAAIVDSAFLFLYHNPTSSDQGHSTLSGSNATFLRRVTSAWDETTVTLNTQPTYDTAGEYKIPSTTSGTENYRIPVKDMVQLMLDTTEGNHGWILMLENETAYRSMIFASSDNLDQTIRPRLDIYYRVSGLSTQEQALVLNQDLKLFPNPANTKVSLEWSHAIDSDAKLFLRDIQGRVLKSIEISAGQKSVDLDLKEIPKGNYIVQVSGDGFRMQSKLVVIK